MTKVEEENVKVCKSKKEHFLGYLMDHGWSPDQDIITVGDLSGSGSEF